MKTSTYSTFQDWKDVVVHTLSEELLEAASGDNPVKIGNLSCAFEAHDPLDATSIKIEIYDYALSAQPEEILMLEVHWDRVDPQALASQIIDAMRERR